MSEWTEYTVTSCSGPCPEPLYAYTECPDCAELRARLEAAEARCARLAAALGVISDKSIEYNISWAKWIVDAALIYDDRQPKEGGMSDLSDLRAENKRLLAKMERLTWEPATLLSRRCRFCGVLVATVQIEQAATGVNFHKPGCEAEEER